MLNTMFLFCILVLFITSGLSEAEDATSSELREETNMKIEVLHKPVDCGRLSKRLDILSMHYTGSLTETSSKFDSR